MRTEELTEDNLDQYDTFLDPEEAENIGRESYRGVVVADSNDGFGAGAIWEVKYVDNDDKDTVSRLTWFSSPDTDCGKN